MTRFKGSLFAAMLSTVLLVGLCPVLAFASQPVQSPSTNDAPLTAQAAETQSMYRLYNPNSGEHFYTADASERNDLVRVGWVYESVGWTAPKTSKTPVYRLYSGTDHHYTMDASERDMLKRAGWRYEGIGWYSDDAKGVPLYRQFNPNVQPSAPRNNSGSHNYTKDLAEHKKLISIGWIGEDIGWYGIKTGSQVTQPDTPSTSGIVFVTRTGTKYHSASCPTTKTSQSKGELKQMTLEEAERLGYTPCKDCRP